MCRAQHSPFPRRCLAHSPAGRGVSRAVASADTLAARLVGRLDQFAACKSDPEAAGYDEAALSRWSLMMRTFWRKMATAAGSLHVKIIRRNEYRKLRHADRLAKCLEARRREKAKIQIREYEQMQSSVDAAAGRIRTLKLLRAELQAAPESTVKNAALNDRLEVTQVELLKLKEWIPKLEARVVKGDRLFRQHSQTYGPTFEALLAARGMHRFWTNLEDEIRAKIKVTPTADQVDREIADAEAALERGRRDLIAARLVMDAALATGRPSKRAGRAA